MATTDNAHRSRIDMDHGFMKIIVKNQVDRDNYDKEMKTQPEKPTSNSRFKKRKPDRSAYVPPMHRTNKEEVGPVWFHVEYEDQGGTVHRLTLYKDCDIRKMTSSFCVSVGLTGSLAKAMVARVTEEARKRKVTPDDAH